MPKCGATVFHGFSSSRCGRNAKYEVHGRWYCGIHNPNRPKTKAQIRADLRHDMENARQDMRNALMHACRCIQELRGVGVEEHVKDIVRILDEFDDTMNRLTDTLEQLEVET